MRLPTLPLLVESLLSTAMSWSCAALQASNILLNHQAVLLSDFGIAAEMERNLDNQSTADIQFGQYLRRHSYVGTPIWMAPEVIDQCCG